MGKWDKLLVVGLLLGPLHYHQYGPKLQVSFPLSKIKRPKRKNAASIQLLPSYGGGPRTYLNSRFPDSGQAISAINSTLFWKVCNLSNLEKKEKKERINIKEGNLGSLQ